MVSRGVIRMTPVGSERGIYWGPVLSRHIVIACGRKREVSPGASTACD